MAILRPKEIRNLGKEETQKQLQQLRSELSREQAAIASGTRPENPGRVKEVRRTIARILTIEKEQPKAAEKGQPKAVKKEPVKAGKKVKKKPAKAVKKAKKKGGR